MSGHISSVDPEFGYTRQAVPSLHSILRRQEMKVRPNRKIWGKPLEASCPACLPACVVACGAVALEAALTVSGVRSLHGRRGQMPVIFFD